MPVSDTHPEYDLWKDRWKRCRDVVAGADEIKDAGSTYLPVPGGLTQSDERYQAYKTRAKWFAATARTVEGLEGEVFRNDPQIEASERLEATFQDITLTGMSIEQYMRFILTERLTVGRVGELVEFSPAQQRTFSALYTTENIINWRVGNDLDNQQLQMVVLKEIIDDPDVADEFGHEERERFRVLKLDEAGLYMVEIYESRKQGGGTETLDIVDQQFPEIRGARLPFIPFVFYGVGENTADVEKPPMLDLVDLNIADYRNSADLEHGRHFCGLPMHFLFGATEYEDGPIAVGSGEVLFSTNADAKAGIVEFTGQGLSALEKAREENRSEMALLGAKLLEEQKRVGETSEAMARRQSGKASVLQAMVEVQDQAHELALKIKAMWEGIGQPDIMVSLNKDYVVAKLEAPEMTALVQAWQTGAMSKASLFWNLQQGERIPPDTTFEEESAALAEEAPDFEFPDTEAAG